MHCAICNRAPAAVVLHLGKGTLHACTEHIIEAADVLPQVFRDENPQALPSIEVLNTPEVRAKLHALFLA